MKFSFVHTCALKTSDWIYTDTEWMLGLVYTTVHFLFFFWMHACVWHSETINKFLILHVYVIHFKVTDKCWERHCLCVSWSSGNALFLRMCFCVQSRLFADVYFELNVNKYNLHYRAFITTYCSSKPFVDTLSDDFYLMTFIDDVVKVS